MLLRHAEWVEGVASVPDLAAVAALVGDPARAAMLTALADGRALPAGQLAASAGVSAATATAHLHRLVGGGLVEVAQQGRHRYHRLAGADVAAALEALARIAPPRPVTSLRQHTDARALAEARTCYDHLAGRLGVELRDRMLALGVIEQVGEMDHELTAGGLVALARWGIDIDQLRGTRRIFARSCLDWTERRTHLAGALPAAMTSALLKRGLLIRGVTRRLHVAPRYGSELVQLLSH